MSGAHAFVQIIQHESINNLKTCTFKKNDQNQGYMNYSNQQPVCRDYRKDVLGHRF